MLSKLSATHCKSATRLHACRMCNKSSSPSVKSSRTICYKVSIQTLQNTDLSLQLRTINNLNFTIRWSTDNTFLYQNAMNFIKPQFEALKRISKSQFHKHLGSWSITCIFISSWTFCSRSKLCLSLGLLTDVLEVSKDDDLHANLFICKLVQQIGFCTCRKSELTILPVQVLIERTESWHSNICTHLLRSSFLRNVLAITLRKENTADIEEQHERDVCCLKTIPHIWSVYILWTGYTAKLSE